MGHMVKRTSRELQRDVSIYTLISLVLVIPVFAAIYFDWNFEAAKALFAIGVVAVSVVGMQGKKIRGFGRVLAADGSC